jgi:hypothetical protein
VWSLHRLDVAPCVGQLVEAPLERRGFLPEQARDDLARFLEPITALLNSLP